MLFLDTNILKSVALRGADAELLRVLRSAKAERAAAPETVLVELAAQQAILYQKKAKAAQAALEDLRKASPWRKTCEIQIGTADEAREYWREQYEKIVDSIEPTLAVYKEAHFREANLLPPCKDIGTGRKAVKVGSRDAVIWLTAVAYAREHPDETVRFVSADSDFNRVSEFGRSLREDLAGVEDRFVLHTSLGDVLPEFARKVPAVESEVRALLSSDASWQDALQWTRVSFLKILFDDVDGWQRVARSAEDLGEGVTVTLADVANISAYEIAGHKWYIADARWAAACPLPMTSGLYFLQRWTARVMASEAHQSPGVTVLVNGGLHDGELADRELFPELARRFVVNKAITSAEIARSLGTRAIVELLRHEERNRRMDILLRTRAVGHGVDTLTLPSRDLPEADDFPEGHVHEPDDERWG